MMKTITSRDELGRIKKGSGRTHGMSDDPIYDCWINIKARCEKPEHPNYHQYGGRGIKICEQWKNSFATFYADIGSKPSKRHTLDRIDVNGDYEPTNCRWITIQEQQLNRRNNTATPGVELHHGKYWVARITFNGKKIYIGTFRDRQEAYKARKSKERELGICI